jgi:hydrogenase maturation protease
VSRSHPGTLVLGLGNPILTDDGVGIHVARAVAARLRSQPDLADGVGFAEASVGGLRLLELVAGYERVILVDAIQTPDGLPGDIYRFSPAESLGAGGDDPRSSLDRDYSNRPRCSSYGTMHAGSTHDLSLQGALAWGRHNGMALPDDDDILIVAVEAQDVLTFGETCTPAVAAAIPRAAATVFGLLRDLNR